MAACGDAGPCQRWSLPDLARGEQSRVFSPTWRGLTLALALVLAVAMVTVVAEVDILSDVVTAVGAAILTPVWAVTTARGLPATARETLR
jgi:hypothetical protein